MPASNIRLRDATFADADLLQAWAADAELGGYNDFSPDPGQPAPDDPGRRPLRGEDGGMLIVERQDGTPMGTVTWHAVEYGPNRASAAWNVGIELRPEYRGHGFGAGAQRQLAAHLFATTTVNRVEASTDIENVAEQRSLQKAGFRREGVQRGAQFRGGTFHDLVTYAILRGEVG
jgi:RimJ/RimL family protein N-acetyltransferase